MRSVTVTLPRDPPLRRSFAGAGLDESSPTSDEIGAAKPTTPGAALGRGSTGAPRDLCLLIIDDDPLMTDLLPRKLQRAMTSRVRIVTATTPDEAIDALSRESPDVVLSDYNLRDVKNGLDVLADAARHVPSAARILFSGHTKREIGRPLERADIHGYVEKPMKLDELVAALLAAIREATGLDLARQEGSDGR